MNSNVKRLRLTIKHKSCQFHTPLEIFFFALDFGAVGLLFFCRILAMSEKNTKFVPRILTPMIWV